MSQPLLTTYDPTYSVSYATMATSARCFSLELLAALDNWLNTMPASTPPHYAVLQSANPNLFNTGGDLALFADLIEAQDLPSLIDYGYKCTMLLHRFNQSMQSTLTVALVRGIAAGGGFEAALSANLLAVETSAKVSFPENRFDLFPGMGAFHFLNRRVGRTTAIRMMEGGKTYTGRQLYDMGIADMVFQEGRATATLNRFFEAHKGDHESMRAVRQIAEREHPIGLSALNSAVRQWAEVAIDLAPKQIKLMRRLAHQQQKR